MDRRYPDIFYVPENAEFSVREGSVKWQRTDGQTHQLTLRADEIYVLPMGYENPPGETAGGSAWRLVGVARRRQRCATSLARFRAAANRKSRNRSATSFCEGPCSWATIDRDIDQVAEILKKDFSGIYKDRHVRRTAPRGPF